jgi:hypothetical protein
MAGVKGRMVARFINASPGLQDEFAPIERAQPSVRSRTEQLRLPAFSPVAMIFTPHEHDGFFPSATALVAPKTFSSRVPGMRLPPTLSGIRHPISGFDRAVGAQYDRDSPEYAAVKGIAL